MLPIAVLDQQHRTLQPKGLLHPEPVIEVRMLVAGIGYQHIDRATGQKKLMGGKVNLLPAKVPYIHGIICDLARLIR